MQVAVRTSVYTAVALTTYSKCLTIVDASRNVYLLFRYLLYSALTVAGMARVVDYLTLTATATASRGLSDVSKSVLCVILTVPVPWQSGQVLGEEPAAAPVP